MMISIINANASSKIKLSSSHSLKQLQPLALALAQWPVASGMVEHCN